MRVILHGVSNDVGDLVVAAVFKLTHRVQNPALHRLQAIAKVRNGTLHDHVAGVIEEVIGIHSAQRKILARFLGIVGFVHVLAQTVVC